MFQEKGNRFDTLYSWIDRPGANLSRARFSSWHRPSVDEMGWEPGRNQVPARFGPCLLSVHKSHPDRIGSIGASRPAMARRTPHGHDLSIPGTTWGCRTGGPRCDFLDPNQWPGRPFRPGRRMTAGSFFRILEEDGLAAASGSLRWQCRSNTQGSLARQKGR
jgi:hypothetical protein